MWRITAPIDGPALRVARVVPDVTGLDKEFDYLIPDAMQAHIDIGTMVRVPLHGRRVGGWVVRVGPPDGSVSIDRLVPVAKISGRGPSPEVIDLARWAAMRWAAGRLRPFLVAASPSVMVSGLPPRTVTVTADAGPATSSLVQLTPSTDPLTVIDDALVHGPCLVVHPSLDEAHRLAARLRRAGRTTAVHPQEWARSAGGVDVVIGGRTAVWATCPGLRTIVILDEHDEALQEERAPTWHARDVAIERARRLGAACVLVSPCPTATALRWAGDDVSKPSFAEERDGWPILEIVDRSKEEPWKRSLLTSPLIQHLRNAEQRVICVINTKGRARLLACRTCRALQRCEHCQAAVVQDSSGSLVCQRCGTVRPVVCQNCGSGALAVLRPGVSRLREEIEAAAGRPVGEVTGQSEAVPDQGVLIGTEAVLHRVSSADVVAFLDLDAELLAPRYRAGEQAMALLVRAARLVGPRRRGGRLLVQTFVPRHEVLQAVLHADPSRAAKAEMHRRQLLGLPPFSALAAVSGAGAADFAAATGLEASPAGDTVLLRADSWDALGSALASTPRPRGSRLRIEVDPRR
jgi:primosomal protein N' (replication factor Y) (superfamily II helicase)